MTAGQLRGIVRQKEAEAVSNGEETTMTDRILRPCLALGAVLVVWPLTAPAAEPIDAQKKITIEEANPAPGRIPDGGLGIQAHTWRFSDPKNPGVTGYTATVSYSYLAQYHKGLRLSAARLTLPPDLPRGTILPLIGYLYRVNLNGGDTLSLWWVPEADLPAGLNAVKPDSLFVHLDPTSDVSGTHFLIPDKDHHSRLVLRKVEREKDGAKRLVATVEFVVAGEKPVSAEVREGDVLATPHVGGYEVRSIVPGDPKAGVLGWVELSGKMIADADLAKEKRPVVRFPGTK
jgi:hypothetical protein